MGGTFTQYTIQWFNAITGDLIFSEIQTPSGGDLAMKFPFLSSSAEQPIVFFQVFPEGDPSFKASSDSTTLQEIAYEISMPNDSSLTTLEPTNWEDAMVQEDNSALTDIVSIAPNPTSGKVSVKFNLKKMKNAKWILANGAGAVLLNGSVTTPNFIVDLSVYANGSYYLILKNEENKYVRKIVKQ